MIAPVFGIIMKGGENMEILYYSQTGNVKRFVEKLRNELPFPIHDILEKPITHTSYILITPTTGFGQVPGPVRLFLEQNQMYIRGVVGSGNRNWADSFCQAAVTISETHNVPLIHKFELNGMPSDVIKVKETITRLQEEEDAKSNRVSI